MICIKCKRPIDKSYGAKGLIGCYCQNCAVMCGLTQEAIEKSRLESVMVQTEKKILTDIRDYLVSWRDNPAIDYSAERWIDETAIPDLTEYAEKLGVEL